LTPRSEEIFCAGNFLKVAKNFKDVIDKAALRQFTTDKEVNVSMSQIVVVL